MKPKLFVCGDTHGMTKDTQKLNSENFPEQKNLTKDDVLIQLGDFGWVWFALNQKLHFGVKFGQRTGVLAELTGIKKLYTGCRT